MIKQIPLYVNPQERQFYYLGDANCKYCDCQLEDLMIVAWYFAKREHDHILCCEKCFIQQKVKDYLKSKLYFEYKVAVIVESLPVGAIPFIIKVPEFTNANVISTFEAVTKPCDKIQDNTIHADRQNFEGLSIGVMPEPKQDIIDIDRYLDDEQHGKPIIEYDKQGKVIWDGWM